MKKVTILMDARRRHEALEALRKLGLLHPKQVRDPISGDISVTEAAVEKVERALRYLPEGGEEHRKMDPDVVAAWVETIIALLPKKETLVAELEELRKQQAWFDVWGNISPASVQKLRDSGLSVRFYVADKKALQEEVLDHRVQIVRQERNVVFVALISDDADEHLLHKEVQMPLQEPETVRSETQRIERELHDVRQSLQYLADVRQPLQAYRGQLMRRLEFQQVLHGMGEDTDLAYLQGFCPAHEVEKLTQTADREKWAYLIDDPDDADEVPTLIRTPNWLRVIDPVFRFMGTVPGYKEYDVSFWFLIFFSIFFALLIGDAGYGLIFLISTFLFSRKLTEAPREPFKLMYVLGGATVLWGGISGNWFGYEQLARLPLLSTLVIDRVNSFVAENQYFVMYLSFAIGVVHLTIARALAAIKIVNTLRALSELGWILILWALFFLTGNLVLGKPLPAFITELFVAGAALVVVFANPRKNLFRGMLQTLLNLPLDIVRTFSDVVSYIRLFAVGLATVIVASSFNEMALQIGFGSIISGFMASLVLLLGHGLNITLALMAVVVHGVRLNLLEFSGQLNMHWSGKPYKPFKE